MGRKLIYAGRGWRGRRTTRARREEQARPTCNAMPFRVLSGPTLPPRRSFSLEMHDIAASLESAERAHANSDSQNHQKEMVDTSFLYERSRACHLVMQARRGFPVGRLVGEPRRMDPQKKVEEHCASNSWRNLQYYDPLRDWRLVAQKWAQSNEKQTKAPRRRRRRRAHPLIDQRSGASLMSTSNRPQSRSLRALHQSPVSSRMKKSHSPEEAPVS